MYPPYPPSYYGYETKRTEFDLNDVKRLIVAKASFENDVFYDVVWDKTLSILSIEIQIDLKSYRPYKNAPKKFRKLVDADNFKDAMKVWLAFEDKELEALLVPYKEFVKNYDKLQKEQQKQKDQERELLYAEKVKNHWVQVGDSVLDLSKKISYIVEKVEYVSPGCRYKLQDRAEWLYEINLFKEKLTQKGTPRKTGFLYLGKVVPASAQA